MIIYSYYIGYYVDKSDSVIYGICIKVHAVTHTGHMITSKQTFLIVILISLNLQNMITWHKTVPVKTSCLIFDVLVICVFYYSVHNKN